MKVAECSKILRQKIGCNLPAHKKKEIAKLTPSVSSSIHQNHLLHASPNACVEFAPRIKKTLFKMAALLRASALSPTSSLQFFSLGQAGYCDHFSQFPGGIF